MGYTLCLKALMLLFALGLAQDVDILI